MIYNSGDFLSIPWDVIIKQFKLRISGKVFGKLDDLVDEFIDHVRDEKFGSAKFESLSFGFVFSDIIDTLKSDIEYNNKIEMQQALIEQINSDLDDLHDVDFLDIKIPYDAFKKKFGRLIIGLARAEFRLKIHKYILDRIITLVYAHIVRQSSSDYSTGIVFGGFGNDELFPSVKNIYVDGRCMGVTRVWKSRPDFDLNESRSQNAAIIPFAQVDMARLFMEGINNKYEQFINYSLEIVLKEKIEELIQGLITDADVQNVERHLQHKQVDEMLRTFRQEFSVYRSAEFTKPIMDTIRALPREEMAYMARAMVEITALRRRFASSVESVGGDIDVAVISKSDGFVWIHRKHYFDIDKNPDFMQRKTSVRGN